MKEETDMVATTLMTAEKKTKMKSKIHVEQSYAHPRAKVWRALTVPALMQKWGMRPEGFAAVVGTKFKLVDDGPHRGWRGFVACEVLAVENERLLVTSWVGDEKEAPQTVSYRLDDEDAGTKLTLDHEGFEGIGGFLLSKFILGPGWKSMMRKKLTDVIGGVA
jgi:uncharacterized protein YndB with AHSA1/START domain